MLDIIIEQFWAQTWVEWLLLITAIFYVVLAARENIWCWFWGIINGGLWAYLSFKGKLYADAMLQLYYVAIGFWGIYQWKFKVKNAEEKELKISSLSLPQHVKIIILCVLISLPFGYFLKGYTDAAATYLDSITSVFAIFTTILVARKILENWLYWIIIDGVYIYLYGSRGMLMSAFIMGIYVIISVFGYFNWKKELSSGE